MEKWIEVSVRVPENRVDAVAAVLDRFGSGGAVVEAAAPSGVRDLSRGAVWTVRSYLRSDRKAIPRKRSIRLTVSRLFPAGRGPVPHFRVTRESEWTARWKKGYDTHRVGRRVVVVPSWKTHGAKPRDIVIRVDPGLAFGTGLHPTTRLCLRALERYVRPGAVVLDVGTGSGILAIAAAGLGAARVIGIDNDPRAAKVAWRNSRANGVAERIRVVRGTLLSWRRRLPKADLIVANLLSGTVLKSAPVFFSKLKPGGRLIASGILTRETDSVGKGLRAAGFSRPVPRFEAGWSALIAKRATA